MNAAAVLEQALSRGGRILTGGPFLSGGWWVGKAERDGEARPGGPDGSARTIRRAGVHGAEPGGCK